MSGGTQCPYGLSPTTAAERRSALGGGQDAEVRLSAGPTHGQCSAVLGFGGRGTVLYPLNPPAGVEHNDVVGVQFKPLR